MKSFRDFVPRSAELFSRRSVFGQGSSQASYGAALFARDCLAGIIVGVVALPLAMAFSIASGGTPAEGLYTAIAAGFCISAFGGSRYQIGGPTGAFVVIIYGVRASQGTGGLLAATLLAGILLVVMGLTGVGRLVKYIPGPVITGFTAGIALIIFSQQVKDFFGLQLPHAPPEFFEKWAAYLAQASTFHAAACAVGLGTLGIMVLLRRFAPRIPGAPVAVVTVTAVCRALALPVETIGTRFGGLPTGLPLPVLPAMNMALLRGVLPGAFSIALLAAIESLLSAVVADDMTGDRHNADMELVGQGIGNMASAIFGGIPATGAIARTAANIKNGAVSPVAGMVHALTLVLFILCFSRAASAIPLSCLAAVLMVVAWDMSSLRRCIGIIRGTSRSDAVVLLVTFAFTVVFDLVMAVGAGVALAFIWSRLEFRAHGKR
ncbi:MAG: sodium-independent anion transporter [Spirochaetaceae bacterium]|jgi:SulP family sulfate permease|nr:sodium-independent anion transporter [Spirochaetaceae bacterium]